jgi:4-hydroxy-tetrahydrodipicolinate reductase
VVIDFSAPVATRQAAERLASHAAKTALVSGTTGLGADDLAVLERAARNVPLLWEPNMSIGVHVLGRLVAEAVKRLGPEYDIEVVETHHGRKVDAPSGTALRLVEVAHAAMGEASIVHGRSGKPGARPRGEIGVHAVRGGDVIGDHEVHFLGNGERIELTHKATSRDLFARGALRAAEWIAGRSAGRYTLVDVLA